MGRFGGWDMPLYYKDMGIMKEHLHCRAKVAILSFLAA
jgi:glycine cleavage system aminomethyltransferase T